MSTITPEEVERALRTDDKAQDFTCPQCSRTFDSLPKLNGHLGWHKTHPDGGKPKETDREKGKPEPRPALSVITTALSEAAQAEVAKAVKNTQAIGHFPLVMGIAPHTGLALAGLKDEKGKVIVRSRAEIAGQLILEIRDAEVLRRVLAMLRWYNALFELTAAADLVGSIAVAGAVDARLIPPDFTVKIPVGGMTLDLPIVQAAIGDVTAELAARGLYETAEEGQPPTTPGDGQEVQGGVENT